MVPLATLAKRGWELGRRKPETGGKQLAVARNIGDDGHGVPLDGLVHHDRASASALQLEDKRGDV